MTAVDQPVRMAAMAVAMAAAGLACAERAAPTTAGLARGM
jgi:hypothetical protein